MEPVEKLRFVLWVHLGEVLPLEAKRGRSPLLLLDEVRGYEARDAAADLPAPAAPGTDELGALDVAVSVGARDLERLGRDGTEKILE